MNQSADSKIAAMSGNLLAQFSSMLGQFELELSNPYLLAELEASGHTPSSGQSLPLCRPVRRTDVYPHRFQGTVGGPIPCCSGYAHTKSVSHDSARSALGAGSAQPFVGSSALFRD